MTSVDKYRASFSDRPLLSPVRGIPPPVPTPPVQTARTSPPRPPSLSQTASPPPDFTSASPFLQDPWLFSAEEIISTPSVIDGLPPAEERLRRAKGVNFIYQAGVLLDLPQITLWVAGVFFHRFYMRRSMVEEKGGIHHYDIAATALFLAIKSEENCRKTKDVIVTVARVAQKQAKLVVDEQSKEYWRWRDSILMYEEVMLEQLTFDLVLDNPYTSLFTVLRQLDLIRFKDLRQSAWAYCNDACLTMLPLRMCARDIAYSAVLFASVHTRQQIADVNGQAWWVFLKADEIRCVDAIALMRQLYHENPLRKQNPSLPSPPLLLDSTRRRDDPSTDGPDSPETLANGRTFDGSNHQLNDSHDDADAPSTPDSKRKNLDSGSGSDTETLAKRLRPAQSSDSDEREAAE